MVHQPPSVQSHADHQPHLPPTHAPTCSCLHAKCNHFIPWDGRGRGHAYSAQPKLSSKVIAFTAQHQLVSSAQHPSGAQQSTTRVPSQAIHDDTPGQVYARQEMYMMTHPVRCAHQVKLSSNKRRLQNDMKSMKSLNSPQLFHRLDQWI